MGLSIPALHFVGFKGDEFISAVRVFGKPDFFHRVFDARALAEFMDDDTIIFARGTANKFTPFTFDDSR